MQQQALGSMDALDVLAAEAIAADAPPAGSATGLTRGDFKPPPSTAIGTGATGGGVGRASATSRAPAAAATTETGDADDELEPADAGDAPQQQGSCASKLPFTSPPVRPPRRRKSKSTAAPVRPPPLGLVDNGPDWQGPCDSAVGFGMLERWAAKLRPVCTAPIGRGESASSMECAFTVHPMMPPPTAPHVYCRVRGLELDVAKLAGRRTCPAKRPGYMCETPATYLDYAPGALGLRCAATPELNEQSFPRDLLADLIDSVTFPGTPRPSSALVVSTPVLLVSRERGEHFNLFHSMTDFVNAFASAVLHGWDPAQVTVLLMDAHVPAPFDPLWSTLFARAIHVRELGQKQPADDEAGVRDEAAALRRAERIWLEDAAISPPGYTSAFFAHDDVCSGRTGFLRQFARYMLASVGAAWASPPARSARLRALFVSRRPYRSFVDHSYMGRQIVNMPEVFAALRAIDGLVVEEIDFAALTFAEQLAAVAGADMLIGMHGAALTHSLFLPDHAAVVELRTVTHQAIMYRHTSVWSGLVYKQWLNTNPAAFCTDQMGDYTAIDPASLVTVVADALREVRETRLA